MRTNRRGLESGVAGTASSPHGALTSGAALKVIPIGRPPAIADTPVDKIGEIARRRRNRAQYSCHSSGIVDNQLRESLE